MVVRIQKYIFNPSPRIEFDDYDEYTRFRDKVDLAILKLGFSSHTKFLRELYRVLEAMTSDEEVEARHKSIINLLEVVRRKFTKVRA